MRKNSRELIICRRNINEEKKRNGAKGEIIH